jgi:hypothetical protein
MRGPVLASQHFFVWSYYTYCAPLRVVFELETCSPWIAPVTSGSGRGRDLEKAGAARCSRSSSLPAGLTASGRSRWLVIGDAAREINKFCPGADSRVDSAPLEAQRSGWIRSLAARLDTVRN